VMGARRGPRALSLIRGDARSAARRVGPAETSDLERLIRRARQRGDRALDAGTGWRLDAAATALERDPYDEALRVCCAPRSWRPGPRRWRPRHTGSASPELGTDPSRRRRRCSWPSCAVSLAPPDPSRPASLGLVAGMTN